MDKRTKIALGFTALYVMGAFVVIGYRFCEFVNLPLNSLGDFLAGAFGPLALAWVVFGYFQQGEELRSSTEEMKFSVAELKRQSETADARFEHERAVQKEQQKRHKSKISPEFKISVLDFRFENQNIICTLELINFGAPVYDVKVSVEDSNLMRSVYLESYFDHNQRAAVEFGMVWNISRDHAARLPIEVTYKDIDSDICYKIFDGVVRRRGMTGPLELIISTSPA
jgi:hypothetical protein